MIDPKEIEKEIKSSMRKCQSFAKKEYGITRKCKLTLSLTRDARSCGWADGINLYPKRHFEHEYFRDGDLFWWKEYKLIHDSPSIGGFKTADWRLIIRALVAHEFAHFMQGVLWQKGNKRMRKPHGEGWRDIYADLRWLIVNRDLKQEKEAA